MEKGTVAAMDLLVSIMFLLAAAWLASQVASKVGPLATKGA